MLRIPKRLVLAISLLGVVALALSLTSAHGGKHNRGPAVKNPVFHVIEAMPINSSPIPPGGLHTRQNGNLGESEELFYHGGPVQRTTSRWSAWWATPG